MIQAGEEAQWQALKREAGGRLDGFDGPGDRLQRVDALDDAIAAWTAQSDARSLMSQLQSAGVPAAATHDLTSLFDDPHLAARGYWQWLDRAVVGRQPHPSLPYRTGSTPLPISRPAPTLGQHNQEILEDMLGLGQDDLESLAALRVFGNRPRIKRGGKAAG